MDDGDAIFDLQPAQRASHRFQIFPRQCRPLDARDHRLIGDRVEKIKRAQVGQVAAALEKQCVGLDAVDQSRRQALGRFHPGGAQIFGEDRRGRAIVAAQIGEACFESDSFWMVIDHEVDTPQRLLEVRRLHVDERQAGAVVVQILIGNLLNLNVEQTHHGQILRPRDGAKSDDRGRRPIAPEQLAQR
jgi:hypothetical protein